MESFSRSKMASLPHGQPGGIPTSALVARGRNFIAGTSPMNRVVTSLPWEQNGSTRREHAQPGECHPWMGWEPIRTRMHPQHWRGAVGEVLADLPMLIKRILEFVSIMERELALSVQSSWCSSKLRVGGSD